MWRQRVQVSNPEIQVILSTNVYLTVRDTFSPHMASSFCLFILPHDRSHVSYFNKCGQTRQYAWRAAEFGETVFSDPAIWKLFQSSQTDGAQESRIRDHKGCEFM